MFQDDPDPVGSVPPGVSGGSGKTGYVGTIIARDGYAYYTNRNDWTEEEFNSILAYVGMVHKASDELDGYYGVGGHDPFFPNAHVRPPQLPRPRLWDVIGEGLRSGKITRLEDPTPKDPTPNASTGLYNLYENGWYSGVNPWGSNSNRPGHLGDDIYPSDYDGLVYDMTYDGQLYKKQPIGDYPIKSIYGGVVVEAKYTGKNSNGYLVTIKHTAPDGSIFYSFYAHMKPDSIEVSVGKRVDAGTTVGMLGNTGASSGAHLHLGIYSYGNFQESKSYYNQVGYMGKSFNDTPVKSIDHAVQPGITYTFYDPREFLRDPTQFGLNL